MRPPPASLRRGRAARPARQRGGFTLIELIIGIGMILLISGGVYQIVLSIAEASSEIQRQQARRESLAALVDTLRAVLRRLPSGAGFELAPRSPADGSPVDVIFRDDPSHPFCGEPPPEGTPILLRLEPQGQGVFHLCRFLGRPAPPGVFDPPVEPETRLVLLRDIRSMRWEVFDSQRGEWVSEFPKDGSRPRLARLDLLPAEEAVPMRVVFALAPKVTRQPGGGGGPQPPDGGNPQQPPNTRPPIEVEAPNPVPE